MINPFFYPNPVPPSALVDRRKELQRIVNRIQSGGQSSAITGEPRSGKTSLLEYLGSPDMRVQIFGANSSNLLLRSIDGQALGSQLTQTEFWQIALHPIYEAAVSSCAKSQLVAAYDDCRRNMFGTRYIEALFVQMRASNLSLVLLFDEFDALLYHPILCTADFFGGLRSLASRSKGSFVLVTASRSSLGDLIEVTRPISRNTSPYFNFLAEISLGPLPLNAVGQLLARAADRFTRDDRLFITAVAGEQPYLLQVAAFETWQAHQEGELDTKKRQQTVGSRTFSEVVPTLQDTWHQWTPTTKMAFAAIALPQITSMKGLFRTRYLLADLKYFVPELKQLKNRGWIIDDASVETGWRIRPQIFLWWLADEIMRNVRDDTVFEEWLRNEKLAGILTQNQRAQLFRAAGAMGSVLKDGMKTFVEVVLKGFGESVGK